MTSKDDWHSNPELHWKVLREQYEWKHGGMEKHVKLVDNIIEESINGKPANAPFKPATKEQIEEWKSWITESAVNNYTKMVKKFEKEKWDINAERYKIISMFEWQRKKYMSSERYMAFCYYAKKQYELLNKFRSSNDELDYEVLMEHIKNHGRLITQKKVNKKSEKKNNDQNEDEEQEFTFEFEQYEPEVYLK